MPERDDAADAAMLQRIVDDRSLAGAERAEELARFGRELLDALRAQSICRIALETAADDFARAGNEARRIDVMCDLGALCVARFDVDGAARLATEVLDRSQQIGYRSGEARGHLGLVLADLARGDGESARQRLDVAHSISQDLDDPDLKSSIAEARAAAAVMSGDFSNLAELLGQLAEEPGDPSAEALGLRGMIRELVGDEAEADPLLASSVAAFGARADDPLSQAMSLLLSAESAFEAGGFKGASEVLAPAIDAFAELGNELLVAQVHFVLNELARRAGLESERRHHADQALELAEKLQVPDVVAMAACCVADCLAVGDEPLARDRAEELYRRAIGESRSELVESEALFGLSSVLLDREEYDEALQACLSSVRIRDRMRRRMGTGRDRALFYQRNRPIYLAALVLASAVGDGYAAVEVTEAARADALSSVLRQGGVSIDGEVAAAWAEVCSLESELAVPVGVPASAAVLDEAAAGDRARQLRVLDARLTEAYGELERLVGSAFTSVLDPEAVDSHALHASLGASTQVLMCDLELLADGEGLLFSTWLPPPPAEPEVSVAELSADEVSSYSALLLGHSREPACLRVLENAGHEVWQQLGSALVPSGLQEQLLSEKRVEGLVIVPSATLWGVPFAALRVGELPLVRLAALSLAPSLRVALTCERSELAVGQTALVCLRDLPGAIFERWAIEASFDDVRSVSDPRDLLAHLRDGDGYAVAVLAAHGDAGPGLAQSLEFDSGVRLSAGQLLGAKLPRLMVIGACWSADVRFEPGVEPLGLSTVALTQGARGVLGGVFDLPSEETGVILSEMYDLLGRGRTLARALQSAQTSYLDSHDRARPIDWSGLVVFGGF